MGKPKAPQPPDYKGAAEAQGAASKEAAIASAQLANPNVTNPYGTQTVNYTTDPTTGNPVPNITQQFSPDQQQIFQNYQDIQNKLGLIGLGQTGTIATPLDFQKSFGGIPQGRQEVIDAYMSRYDTDAGRRMQGREADLLARGIPLDSEAYSREREYADRSRNDALQQATLMSDDKAMAERRQLISELLTERSAPINELSAFRTGTQMAPLSFSGATGANVGATPYFNAAQAAGDFSQDIYGYKTGAYNSQLGGLAGLGAAAILAMSDRRLKSNIVRIGTHNLGIGIYEYDIFGRREIGVMADEVEKVLPEAVVTLPSGYKAVMYGKLNG